MNFYNNIPSLLNSKILSYADNSIFVRDALKKLIDPVRYGEYILHTEKNTSNIDINFLQSILSKLNEKTDHRKIYGTYNSIDN